MKCKNCGKGRSKFWNKFGGFCNEKCFEEWKEKQKEGENEVECPFCNPKTHKIPMEVWKVILEVYRKASGPRPIWEEIYNEKKTSG